MKKICIKCRKPIETQDVMYHGMHPLCFCHDFHVKEGIDFEDVVAHPFESSSREWAGVISTFFHGKFRKYSAHLGGKEYLLKVGQHEMPELPAMEYLCNQLADSIGLNVPPYFFIKFENAMDTFVCENFMQYHVGGDLIHIYRFLENRREFSCEGLIKVLTEEVGRLTDLHRLIEITLFDALIGNHDRHGRNLGIIQSGGKKELAPFYDNPSYLAVEEALLLGAMHEPRGGIATKETLEPTMRDYVKEWRRLGYDEAVNKFKEKVSLPHIQQLIVESFVSSKRQEAFYRLITRRHEELMNG